LDVIGYNGRAIRAYEKAGFVEEGRLRSAIYRDGNYFDRIMMGILSGNNR
jgi:RimJ/RimL family protein N-acetyltransferase